MSSPQETLGDQPSHNRPTETGQRMLCLWLPNWPIQRLVVSEPELRFQRIVLYRQDPRRGRLVVAASPLALCQGVRSQMPLSEASSLLERADPAESRLAAMTDAGVGTGKILPPAAKNFHVFEYQPEIDLESLQQLADSLDMFSPIIGLETIEPEFQKLGQQPSSLFMEVTGLAHLFGNEYGLAHQLFRRTDQLGYVTRIAIANTVGAAWGAARYLKPTEPPDSHGSARKHHLPDQDTRCWPPVVLLDPDDQTTFWQLPLEALRLRPQTRETLHQLGIQTIDQLLALSRADLAARFGDEIHRRLDQASGTVREPVIARQRPPEFREEQLLDSPTNHRETIETIIGRLVARICEQMQSRQRGALRWEIRLNCLEREPLQFQISLFQATATGSHIMPLVEMQLEKLLQPHTRKTRKTQLTRRTEIAKRTEIAGRTEIALRNPQQQRKPDPSPASPPVEELPAPEPSRDYQFHRYTTIQVQEISVSVSSCVLLVQHQRQLFDENPRLDRLPLAHLINRLSNRLGQFNVVYPRLQSGAQPEFSFRYRPLVDIHRKRSRQPTRRAQPSHAIARPLRLWAPPIPMKLQEAKLKIAASEFDSELAFTWLSGPERIETGWWRGRTVCREYWKVELQTGQQLWIFQDLRSGNWFLQGLF